MLEIVAGWDPQQPLGYSICSFSAIRRTSQPLRFIPLMEKALRYAGLYTRPHEERDGQLWDVISDAPMATAFANSRFCTPWLAKAYWVLSCDFADQMFLEDPAKLFALADHRYAVQVVKRAHEPVESLKMDGRAQTVYSRKNWSSVILWNRMHRSNRRLTKEMVNTLPGRDLHAFCWLKDHEIGDLPGAWNHLVGVDPDRDDAKLLHFTLGTPEVGVDSSYAPLWRSELSIMNASTRTHLMST